MRLPWPRQTRVARRLMPRSLLARSLLIVLVPLVLVEAVALRIFYGTHFDVVSRRFSGAIAGEIAATIDMLARYPAAPDRAATMARAWTDFELRMREAPGSLRPSDNRPPLFAPIGNNLAAALEERVGLPFAADWHSDPNSVVIRIQIGDQVLVADAPRKRLYTGTIYLFVLWLVGSALLLFAIAALFMRNQVRGIRRLADAAEAFGVGRDTGPIKPEGATEVRQAGAAFNQMRARVRRFLAQRTDMLAGVSHDLRTPLTRLRLAVAMLPAPDARTERDIADMTEDLEEMDRMIGGYLAFVRGVGEEPSQPVDLPVLLEEVAARARRAGAEVALAVPEDLPVMLRPDAFRRAVTNLVDNARRHARHVRISAAIAPHAVQVAIEDDGPGIPPARREEVFRPFESGPGGGTGLGLAIALDIVRGHGGNIVLEDSALGGLRALITLPV